MKTNQTKPNRRPLFNETMKTRCSNLVRFLFVLGLAAWAMGPRASAQTPPVLTLQLYAGLSITGSVGTVYQIQYVTDLAQTNKASAWLCLEFRPPDIA